MAQLRGSKAKEPTRSMKDKAALIILACVIRLTSNLLWPFWGGATLYYIGQALFEALILWVLFSFSEGHLKTILSFFLGLACFGLIEEVLFNPTEIDIPEHLGILAGCIFLTYQIIKHERKKS